MISVLRLQAANTSLQDTATISISCEGLCRPNRKSPAEPERLMRATLEALGLTPHPKKTRVLDAREGHYDFLGFNSRKRKNPRDGQVVHADAAVPEGTESA